MLNLCGLDWEPRHLTHITGGDEDSVDFGDVIETGDSPVLDHEGRILAQSGVILSYLAEHAERYRGRDSFERLAILRWLFFDNHKFSNYYSTLRFLLTVQETGETEVTQFLRRRVLHAFGVVERHLAERRFIIGDELTIADIALSGYLFFTEECGIDRGTFPNMRAWLNRIASLPDWQPPMILMQPGAGIPKAVA
jgi:glutathione S-transferase